MELLSYISQFGIGWCLASVVNDNVTKFDRYFTVVTFIGLFIRGFQ